MFNNDDFGNDNYMYEEDNQQQLESATINENHEEESTEESEQESEQETDQAAIIRAPFESPPARRRSNSRRRTPMSSGKKAIRIADCGGVVLVNEIDSDDDENMDDFSMENDMIGPSSVVRMKTVRVVSENDRRSLGSRKALTPVRRSTRLLKESNHQHNDEEDEEEDENNTSMMQLLRQSDMTYVPNPALQGAHFAEEIPLSNNNNNYGGDDNEDDEVLCFDGFNSGGPKENERESTPMPPSRRSNASNASNAMMLPPPPPSSSMGSTTMMMSGITPVRRSTRVAGGSGKVDETPAHIREEMARMLGM